MTKYPHLIINISEFKKIVSDIIEQASLISDIGGHTPKDLADLTAKYEEWNSEVQTMLNTCFATPTNAFLNEFNSIYVSDGFSFALTKRETSLEDKCRRIKQLISQKIEYLEYNTQIIAACDFIATGDKSIIESRKKMKLSEKIELLLSRLYDLNDGKHYPAEMLLTGNGITLRNNTEVREIVEILEDNGYVETSISLGSEVGVRITVAGAIHIEDFSIVTKGQPEDAPANSDEQKAMTEKINEIIQHLNQLGAGQEVLFEELQELKELYTKLNKKNWLQLLKGKIVDMAIDKLADIETIKFIYEKISGQKFRLPG